MDILLAIKLRTVKKIAVVLYFGEVLVPPESYLLF